mmetsp:Transcript_20316/g.25112  ORF Transcript_20316/g.25112 Transcript_20316/m.25112 type:complete len:92 (+) Transcript_20316:50-325(+)
MIGSTFKQLARSSRISSFQHRFSSNISKDALNRKGPTYKSAFLSDPSTYPIMVILGFAVAMGTAVGMRCLLKNPDVQISPKKRSSIVRTWE